MQNFATATFTSHVDGDDVSAAELLVGREESRIVISAVTLIVVLVVSSAWVVRYGAKVTHGRIQRTTDYPLPPLSPD